MTEYMKERIDALEEERIELDEKLARLRTRRDVFWDDAMRLKRMDMPERDKVFRRLGRVSGDAWAPLMCAMDVEHDGKGINADTYDACMDIIRAQPNARELSREFVRSCPYLLAHKLDREIRLVCERASQVNARLSAMYDIGIRVLDSLETSTST